jgi:hypothetical protein
MSEEVPAPAAEYYAVILQADGAFTTERFETIEGLTTRLKALIDKDVSVSCFQGKRLMISKPPLRYLLTPDGNVPLFDASPVIEPDDTGYLGVDPVHFENPPQVKVQPQIKPAANADEFFNDDSDDIVNVFDKILPDPDD